jgi:aspartyl-tRNA(Asn)/glutamyl-tRNA(Gln) amidotransferase subunit A
VPLSLGSDTNGSIRVPSSFCGLFGLKPTYGRLPRSGSFPFVFSLDHLGPLARTPRDLALSYDAMQGFDAGDGACAKRPIEPVAQELGKGIGGLRIATAGGYFRKGLCAEGVEAVSRIGKALNVTQVLELPEVGRARAAAYVITTTEGGSLHLDRLRKRPQDFDPATRDRLIAGAWCRRRSSTRRRNFAAGTVRGCWSCSTRSTRSSRRQRHAWRQNSASRP